MLVHTAGSKWISPLDGNVVVTEEGFLNLGLSLILAEQTKVQFHFLPMYRLVPSDNTIVQRDKKFAELLPSIQRHEAQVSFRYDAPLSYSVGLEYGKRNKFDCLDGFGTTKSSNEQGIAGVEYCGMSVRLPWWTPSTIAFRTELLGPKRFRMIMRASSKIALSSLFNATTEEASRFMNESGLFML
eukprot:GHVN01005430.1.p1 GENE.GHVN01005430.1~~GHVN01005430.1.p1  ORF type:complete len:185 (-),score=14.65 GHVN01005430.1:799-1353(-)